MAQQPNNITSLAELRSRRKARRLRTVLLWLLALLALAGYFLGVYSEAMGVASDLVESARIALTPADGWPVKTGVPDVLRAEELAGGFVQLGKNDLVIYSAGGNRLRSIQHGYARPALSVGNTRFCLYNRSGYELRVESRTRTLRTQTFEQPILLAQMSPNGSVAVVTASSRAVAELNVYDPSLDFRYAFTPTEKEGVPSRIAFASDNKRLAVACLTAHNGSLSSNVFLLDTRSDAVTASIAGSGQVLQLHWLTAEKLLVVYDHMAVVYDAATGAELAVYSYGGETLTAASVSGQNAALLFQPSISDSPAHLVVLDPGLQYLADTTVPAPASRVVATRTGAYVLRESSVAAYTLAGGLLWENELSATPLALVDAKEPLVFSGGQVNVLAAPSEE